MYQNRIHALQDRMKKEKIDFCLIPTSDYHNSEYVSPYFCVREFFSGFTGSNGTLLVEQDEAKLWTDGRYFIQAEMELQGSGIRLMRMMEEDVPSITEYIAQTGCDGMKIAGDGRVLSLKLIRSLTKQVEKEKKTYQLEDCFDPAEGIWADRPDFPCSKIMILSEEFSGMRTKDKLKSLREFLISHGQEALVLSKLDDIMWLFNIRGGDVSCNPVALSYAYIDLEKAVLFLQQASVPEQFERYTQEEDFTCMDYTFFYEYLRQVKSKKISIDGAYTNYRMYALLQGQNELREEAGVITGMKAVKNQIEIQNIKRVFLQDSVVVTKFLYWLKQGNATDEVQAGRYLDQLRSQIPGYLDLSFATICAYGSNAAMMHYEANDKQNARIAKEGMLLVDSGGQYLGGTTDVTRTIAMGTVTESMKRDFTLVLKGHLALGNCRFLYGCTGRNLDILAREPLWRYGMDYKCGTGHGIGYILNVHEGPQSIRWRYDRNAEETILEEGMLVTNEPGVYREGEYGIRTENVLLCRREEKNHDGQFMGFETLTEVPVDIELIESGLLSEEEKRELNQYHMRVYKDISPYLSLEERQWLEKVTAPLK